MGEPGLKAWAYRNLGNKVGGVGCDSIEHQHWPPELRHPLLLKYVRADLLAPRFKERWSSTWLRRIAVP